MRGPVLALAALLAACGGQSGVAALEQRVLQLEQRLQRQEQALQQQGIRVYGEPAKDAAEQVGRTVAALQDALDELESAKDTRDTGRGQAAMQRIEQHLGELRQQRALALPALLQAATQAQPPRQPALLECYARIGGAEVAAELARLLTDPTASAPLRQQAGRSLIECDAPAGIAAVHDLLQGRAPPLSDLYVLVHLLAGTGSKDVVPVLIEALQRSTDRSVRCHAATGLGNFPGRAASETLAAAVAADEYPAVRANALRALTRIDAAQAAALAPAVLAREQDPAVRAAATAAQGAAK